MAIFLKFDGISQLPRSWNKYSCWECSLIKTMEIFAKKSGNYPRTFTNFCLVGIACFWGTSYLFWWRFSKKIPFNAKRKIAQNRRFRDKPWRGNPDYSFIGKVGAEAIFFLIGLSFTLKIGGM